MSVTSVSWGREEDSGAYARHLAAVNEQIRVRASNDVYSVHGVLICRSGSSIDYETAKKIVRHKLTVPLDANVELEQAVTATGIQRRLEGFLETFSDLRMLQATHDFEPIFRKAVTKRDLPKLVAQKLTVMQVRKPLLFEQTVVGAWLACMLGWKMGLSEPELALLALAALSRDVGMLHVDPTLLERPDKHLLDPDDWKAIQSHVIASHMILSECEGIPDRVLAAVIQHHERVDGTGYPAHLCRDDLEPMGQMLAVADTLTAVRLRTFAGSGRNVRDALAILSIESDACRYDVISAAVSLIRAAPIKPSTFHAFETKEALTRALHRRARAMVSFSNMLEDMPNLVPIDGAQLEPVILTTNIERLSLTMCRSGLSDPELVKWLHVMMDGKLTPNLAELVQIDLQQRELLWQLERLYTNLSAWAERKKMRARSPVQLMLERMRQTLDALQNDALVVDAQTSEDSEMGYGEAFLEDETAVV